ncbi:hypothetical protein [Agromyces badenianii]|uniref:hypothetical protein n=1 Tax=Agromyces badenianii TaxID=2080742 RepID=UPI001059EC96|nr:hypothetical protein [Agromyces badenianii]
MPATKMPARSANAPTTMSIVRAWQLDDGLDRSGDASREQHDDAERDGTEHDAELRLIGLQSGDVAKLLRKFLRRPPQPRPPHDQRVPTPSWGPRGGRAEMHLQRRE